MMVYTVYKAIMPSQHKQACLGPCWWQTSRMPGGCKIACCISAGLHPLSFRVVVQGSANGERCQLGGGTVGVPQLLDDAVGLALSPNSAPHRPGAKAVHNSHADLWDGGAWLQVL